MNAESAQAWVNFTLLQPSDLPADCKLESPGLLRKEVQPGRSDGDSGRAAWTEANPCSYIWTIRGKNRSLRLKQFLYDWAIPATDHPALHSHADQPFVINDWQVGWIGTDYKQRRGASAMLWGTMCEASIIEGEFSDEELVKLYHGLKPVDALAALTILETPFADVSYWARYPSKLLKVPIALWQFKRADLEVPYRWLDGADRKAQTIFRPFSPGTDTGWQLNSIGTFGPEDKPSEVEALYTLGNRDRYLSIHTVPFDEENGLITVPPKLDAHPCKSECRMIGGHRVWHAWIDERYGPHDAIFNTNDQVILVQSNSSASGSVTAFLKLLENILSNPVGNCQTSQAPTKRKTSKSS